MVITKRIMSNEEASQNIGQEVVFEILSNPVKRSILRILGERGEVSFTELKTELKTSTGNLYYNWTAWRASLLKTRNASTC